MAATSLSECAATSAPNIMKHIMRQGGYKHTMIDSHELHVRTDLAKPPDRVIHVREDQL